MRAVFVCVLLALPAAGDVVVLQGGGRLSCEVLRETPDAVHVRLPHGAMVIPRTRIAEVVREDRGVYLRREGRLSLRAGSTRSAVELLERALAHDPEAQPYLVAALEAHAQSLADRFRHDEAKQVLRRLEALEPGHRGARRLVAWILREEKIAAALHERAQRALDLGAYLDALVLLDAWRVRRPVDDEQARAEMAAAHLGAARKEEERGQLRQVLDHYRAAAAFGARRETTEALYLLRPLAVLEALKEGDAGRARGLLDGIATTYPQPAVPVFLRAVRHHLLGEVEAAVRAYADAARLAEQEAGARGLDYDLVRRYAAATLRAAIARPPQEGVTRWRELFLAPLACDDTADHFTVYAASRKLAQEVASLADRHYARITTDLLGRVPAAGKAEIVVHPHREAYLAADPTPPGSPLASVTVSRAQTGGVCYDTLDEQGQPLVRLETYAGPGLGADTLPHEIVHLVQRRGLPVFRRGHWLDEGLAMLYESEQNQANRRALWRRLSRNPIPLPELLVLPSTPPDRVATFYHQAHAFACFLRGLGDDEDWRRFLASFGRMSFETAVRQVYEIESVDVLERRWLKELEGAQ
ncbi:MAG: tetratricopeptide repeat protein [Planctomycetota bacterium]|jgi:tetratricopeptide (TPR) repeat protein